MKYTIIHSNTRGHVDLGWLNSYHTFSFGQYFNRTRMGFGALRVVNDDWIKPGGGFPMHHHDNMEIITVVLKGIIEHQDNLNNHQQINAGEIQIMSAGTGIMHSEYNPSPTEELNLFQIWIHPKIRNVSPRYRQKSFVEILNKKNTWHTLITPEGENNSLIINQDAYLYLGEFDSGQTAEPYFSKQSRNGIFVMLIEGEALFNNIPLLARDAILFTEIQNLTCKIIKSAKIMVIEIPLAV